MEKLKSFSVLLTAIVLSFCLHQLGKGQTLQDHEVDSLQQLIGTTLDDSTRGRAYNKLAFHYLFTDVEKCLFYLEKGLEEADRHNLKFGKAELLNTKATYYDLSGKKDSAETTFMQSLEISRQHQFKNTEVITFNNLGLLYWKSGEFDRALSCFFQALAINEEHFPDKRDSRANYLSNIGLIYQELKQDEKAIQYHRQSLAIRQQLGHANGQAISYANLGVCHQSLKRYDSSEVYYLQAIEKAEEAQNWWMYHSLYDNLGNIYSLTDRNGEAIVAYKKSLEKPEGLVNNPKGDLSVYGNLTSAYNKLNDPRTAISYAEKGLELLHQHPQLYPFAGDLYFSYAESNYMLGNVAQGREGMLEYRKVLDSTFSEKNASAIAEMEEKYESEKKDKTLLEKQQVIQEKELEIKRRTIWLLSMTGLLLLLAGILYYLFKRKEAMARQSALELKLAEEQERNHIQQDRLRISRELHDNIGSYLTLINASLEQMAEAPDEQPQGNLGDIRKVLSLSMRELRKTVWLLNNPEITMDAVALRLRDFFQPLNQNGTRITVQAQGNTEKILSDIQATHLFRIVQEAVNNAYRHASASNVRITLDTQDKVYFSVVDDGAGFVVASASSGNGMQNMKSRMAELQGQITITSEPGKGTTVSGYF